MKKDHKNMYKVYGAQVTSSFILIKHTRIDFKTFLYINN